MVKFFGDLALEVGRECHYKCDDCPFGQEDTKLSFEDAKKAIDLFDGILNLSFCGGNPAENSATIIKIIDYIMQTHKSVLSFYVPIPLDDENYPRELLGKLKEFRNYISINGGQPKQCKIDTDFFCGLRYFFYSSFYEIEELPDAKRMPSVFLSAKGEICFIPNLSYEKTDALDTRNISEISSGIELFCEMYRQAEIAFSEEVSESDWDMDDILEDDWFDNDETV